MHPQVTINPIILDQGDGHKSKNVNCGGRRNFLSPGSHLRGLFEILLRIVNWEACNTTSMLIVSIAAETSSQQRQHVDERKNKRNNKVVSPLPVHYSLSLGTRSLFLAISGST